MCEYLWVVPVMLFTIVGVPFIIALISDWLQVRKDSKNLFKIIAKDYNDPKRPARK